VRKCAIVALLVGLVLAGCAGKTTEGQSAAPKLVPDSALDGLLLSADEVNAIMGTSGMTPRSQVVSAMGDNRNLLPNLNCLGVWQVTQAPIYDPSHWKTLRQQLLRVPDTEQWNYLVVESVVSYRTADGPRVLFDDSVDKWSKCTNHHVNITLNGGALPKWFSGDLTKTDTQLAMPYTRGEGDQTRSCQHTLTVTANVVIDVQACKPQQPTPITSAVDIADKIESKMPS
jgi:serine/threonine-protein kinase